MRSHRHEDTSIKCVMLSQYDDKQEKLSMIPSYSNALLRCCWGDFQKMCANFEYDSSLKKRYVNAFVYTTGKCIGSSFRNSGCFHHTDAPCKIRTRISTIIDPLIFYFTAILPLWKLKMSKNQYLQITFIENY